MYSPARRSEGCHFWHVLEKYLNILLFTFDCTFLFSFLRRKEKRKVRKEKRNPHCLQCPSGIIGVVLRTISYARYCALQAHARG